MERNFDIMNANTNGILYDYGSVMHYGAFDFSANGEATITPIQQGVTIGQRDALSATDWQHVQIYCSSYIGK